MYTATKKDSLSPITLCGTQYASKTTPSTEPGVPYLASNSRIYSKFCYWGLKNVLRLTQSRTELFKQSRH